MKYYSVFFKTRAFPFGNMPNLKLDIGVVDFKFNCFSNFLMICLKPAYILQRNILIKMMLKHNNKNVENEHFIVASLRQCFILVMCLCNCNK